MLSAEKNYGKILEVLEKVNKNKDPDAILAISDILINNIKEKTYFGFLFLLDHYKHRGTMNNIIGAAWHNGYISEQEMNVLYELPEIRLANKIGDLFRASGEVVDNVRRSCFHNKINLYNQAELLEDKHLPNDEEFCDWDKTPYAQKIKEFKASCKYNDDLLENELAPLVCADNIDADKVMDTIEKFKKLETFAISEKPKQAEIISEYIDNYNSTLQDFCHSIEKYIRDIAQDNKIETNVTRQALGNKSISEFGKGGTVEPPR